MLRQTYAVSTVSPTDLARMFRNKYSMSKIGIESISNSSTKQLLITCLIVYCNHTSTQAEQCALIIHNKGKCSVKTGSIEDLTPICKALQDKGLNAEIQ